MNIKKLFTQHLDYLSKDFNKKNPSNPGFTKTSALVGYTALFYLVPIFFIKNTNKWTSLYIILWGLQTLLVFMADYWIPKMQLQTTGHNNESIIYGKQNYFYPITLEKLSIKLYSDDGKTLYDSQNANHSFEFEITTLKNTELVR